MNDDDRSGPPHFFRRLFRWYCHPTLVERIEGDLLEDYDDRVGRAGKRNADIRFMLDVLLLCRPGIIRLMEGSKNLNNYGMYKSYLTIAWRTLVNNKIYASINVAGLALGITSCLFILLWVKDEVAVDNFHNEGDHLFALYQNSFSNGKVNGSYSTPYPLIYQNINAKTPNEFEALSIDDLRQAVPEVRVATSYATGYE